MRTVVQQDVICFGPRLVNQAQAQIFQAQSGSTSGSGSVTATLTSVHSGSTLLALTTSYFNGAISSVSDATNGSWGSALDAAFEETSSRYINTWAFQAAQSGTYVVTAGGANANDATLVVIEVGNGGAIDGHLAWSLSVGLGGGSLSAGLPLVAGPTYLPNAKQPVLSVGVCMALTTSTGTPTVGSGWTQYGSTLLSNTVVASAPATGIAPSAQFVTGASTSGGGVYALAVLNVDAASASSYTPPSPPTPPSFSWPSAGLSVIAKGDSITAGYLAGTSYLAISVANYFPSGYGVNDNLGIVNEVLSMMLADVASEIAPLIATAHGNGQIAVVSIMGGTNDIAEVGCGATQLIANYYDYVVAARAAGADYIFVVTQLPRGNVTGFETIRTAVNTSLRANYLSMGANGIVDIGKDPAMGSTANLTNTTLYNTDQTHPTATGQGILANYYAPAIMGLHSSCTVTGITPNSGSSSAGGTSVTITGTGFSSVQAVIIGGIQASGFTVNSTTNITATTSTGYGTGTTDVSVITPDGAGTLVNGWTWTT